MNGLFSPREPRHPAGAPDARTPEQGSGSARVRPTAASFKVGAIALAFLILGYQTALFVTRAAGLKLAANRDRPDTVYVYLPADYSPVGSSTRQPSGDSAGPPTGAIIERRNAPHTPRAEAYRRATRRVESFRFNPNTISVEDLIRLGFSEKQAQAIDNYRTKGGRFRRKADFAKSYVVADSVFRRLERFIDIPKVDLNRADSAALDALPGIGPWYAARIVSYRAELGGYSYPEQLMDIYRFDREKYDALSDLVFCSPPAPFALWSLPADSLRLHPYIRSAQAARSIVLFRDHTPREGWTVAALGEAGILPPEDASRLARCRLSPP